MEDYDRRHLVWQHGAERYVAERVARERARRGWSQDELVRRMKTEGHPVPQSAISRLENRPPGGLRQVSVDEAIGFAKVFGMSLEELLLPPDLVEEREIFDHLSAGPQRLAIWRNAEADYRIAVRAVTEAMQRDPKWVDEVRTRLAEVPQESGEPEYVLWRRKFYEDLLSLAQEERA